MKNYHSGKIALGLFVLLFISADVTVGVELSPFTYYKQEENLTCWAACIRMVMSYYDVIIDVEKAGKERDIRRLAFNVPDTASAPNLPLRFGLADAMLLRLLLTSGTYCGSGSLTQDGVMYLIDRGLPIIAGTRKFTNGVQDTTSGHMQVIMGYRRIPNDLELFVADPAVSDSVHITVEYSAFTDADSLGANGGRSIPKWVETIYTINPPLVPPIKNTVVDKIAVKNKTIMSALDALKRDASNFGGTTRAIYVWDTVATLYEERVVIDSTVSDVRIMSDPRFSRNPVLKSPNAVRIDGARGIELEAIDIEGDSAIYNGGELSIFPLKVSAALGPAIRNTGALIVNYSATYVDKTTTVEAKSDHAIYNTGNVIIANGIVSAPSGYAAVINSDINGKLALAGSPTITGSIAGFGAGRVSVYTSGSSVFAPGDKKYTIDQANLRNGDAVVVGGAKFISNFEITDTNFLLATKGNDIVATSSRAQLFVSKVGALFKHIFDAVASALSGQVINVTDEEVYNGQVTVDSVLPGITLRFQNKPIFSRPKIRHFPDNRNVSPISYTALLKRQSHTSAVGDDIKENGALRVFGATGVLIDGIDIEGENAVYNTGAVTIRNGTLSATSDCAIYNTGTIEITDAEVSAESGYAVYNDGVGGSLVLGGSPTITGHIAGFGAGRVGVYTFGDHVFTPGGKKYALSPYNLKSGDIAVSGGSGFIDNFELTDTGFILAAKGKNLVAVALYTVSFNLNGGNGEKIPDITRVLENSILSESQMPLADGVVKTDYVGDGKWYILSEAGYSEFVFGENGTPITDNITLYLKWTPIVSVLTPERIIPPVNQVEEAVVGVPLGALTGGFTAGPIPVNKQGGAVKFFRYGNGIESGTLRIYDALGNFVKKINVGGKGKALSGSDTRTVGKWDLKDFKGRAVPEGMYLVKGAIKTTDGKFEKASLVIGVKGE